MPACNFYKPNTDSRIILGKSNKEKGLNYLTDCEFIGKTIPGPGAYKNKYEIVETQVPRTKFAEPKPIKSWKPKKVKGPDVGSYQVGPCIDKTLPR